MNYVAISSTKKLVSSIKCHNLVSIILIHNYKVKNHYFFTGLLPVANAIELENKCKDKCRAAIVFPDKLEALKTSPADDQATINYEIRMKKFRTSNLFPIQTPRKCHWSWDDDFTTLGPNRCNKMK